MNRRLFLASAAAAALRGDTKLLLPSDLADEYNFRLMWYNPVPAIDPATYRLQVKGLVEKPLSFAVPDLRRLPHDSQNSRLRCVQGWSARTDWGGFRFGHLLEAAKPRKNAKVVRVECADKWYEYFAIEDLLRPRVLFAMDMHGQPLADRHGAPLRIIDPARYGYKSAKLVTSIEFVESGKGSMACDIASYYSPTGEIQPGYDTPLDLGGKTKRKIYGGEITEY
ncbi:MAG TPA: molybdopterin-dependent oxidoreductase [Bryobacteraceae bacterium]|jgi:DMSO/TMAO reductase YedYZ molybdopterin-dependent catalytic subunit|nr:molybdopterin-dependent oxidoreductase [Bryobacteraceae bacterium]